MSRISEGVTVKVHYTGKHLNGEIFDSTVAREPIIFTVGDEMMIPGFEKAVMDMEEGETKIVNIPAAQAYGEYDEELIVSVDRKKVFGDKEIKKGDEIQAPTDDGIMFFKILEVKDDKVLLDGNTELAGKDLIFEIELIKILD
jgi:peptidylprolyl isomerase